MPYELGYHGSSVSYQTVQSAIAHVYINLFSTRSSSHRLGRIICEMSFLEMSFF